MTLAIRIRAAGRAFTSPSEPPVPVDGAALRNLQKGIASIATRLDKIETWAWGKSTKPMLCCSFCGKSQHEVERLIAGPTVFICDECVDLCTAMLRESKQRPTEARP